MYVPPEAVNDNLPNVLGKIELDGPRQVAWMQRVDSTLATLPEGGKDQGVAMTARVYGTTLILFLWTGRVGLEMVSLALEPPKWWWGKLFPV